jgi:hypothetical protein
MTRWDFLLRKTGIGYLVPYLLMYSVPTLNTLILILVPVLSQKKVPVNKVLDKYYRLVILLKIIIHRSEQTKSPQNSRNPSDLFRLRNRTLATGLQIKYWYPSCTVPT